MRTIKFRALKDDMSDCSFVYGCLVYDAVGNPRITHKDLSGKGLLFNSCIKGTEGQFTGLADKNGVEIYEGDLVNFGNNNNVEVKFDNGCFNVFDEPLGWDFTPDYDNNYMPIKSDLRYCEVIGNIYENQTN